MEKNVSKESKSLVTGILGFLTDSGKTNLLSSVAKGLDEVVDKSGRADKIVVTSSVPLTQIELELLKGIVCRFLKRDLPAVNKIDNHILGGFSIRVGDFFLDASLASELASMKQLLLS